MKKSILTLMLMVAMLPLMANAYEQLADGVYQDGSTLYIGSGVTSLGSLQVNSTTIYCYATIPPACSANTFTGYGAALHVPTSAMVNYFTAQYWYNFNNIFADAVEPQSVTISDTEVLVELDKQLSLSATVSPSYATPTTVNWASTNTAVATVSASGMVTAVGIGECYIHATCVNKLAICHVIVTPQRVTITLDKHETRLLPNHTLKLNAFCSPATVELAVSSSNPAVALPRIVSGTIMVVGVAEGTATITVNAADSWGNPDACEITVYTEPGDVNSDGYVNISDVTALIDYLLSGNTPTINLTKADCNNDGNINISDVTTLIDYLLTDCGSSHDQHDEHDYVDLGLPSGTLWATCNVGAYSPEDYGDYFAWGETKPKTTYSWNTYKWCNGSRETLTKYCTSSSYGIVDNKVLLEPEDDAAYVNWGPSWCMPTYMQIQELNNNCYSQLTTLNGVNGWLFTGPNGNSLFLPATGYRLDSSLNYVGKRCDYKPTMAYYLHKGSGIVEYADGGYIQHRLEGLSVRAVRVSQN